MHRYYYEQIVCVEELLIYTSYDNKEATPWLRV